MEIKGGQSDTKLLLVTANVGSLFEDPKRLLRIWIEEFISNVTVMNPSFLAVHLQEVGGKTYENSMDNVQEFIGCLCDAMAKTEYIYVRIYMDEDYKSAEYFTALGNIYFGHKDLCNLRIWNFATHGWDDNLDEGKQIFSGNIEAVSTKEKSKFPQHFFPECKWSRKGFMRTRWEINGTAIDLVNIHLFHDASNLAACEDFPSVYCKTRRKALIHTIERFHLDAKNGFVPFFLFGDFNFRCDTAGVVKELTENLTVHRVQTIKNDSTKINYRNSDGHNILTVGKKEFSHADHQLKFKEHWLKEFDKELAPLTDILNEYPITFMPSYPFEEDPEMPTDYMSTRCPSWCDRILMSPQVKDLIDRDEWKYDMIGETVCMGDHKPIYLTLRLKPNKGTYRSCDCSCLHKNNKNLTSPIRCRTCPYSHKLYKEILKEGKSLSPDSKSQIDLAEFSGASSTLKLDVGEENKQSSSKYPSININIIDSDNIYVCMCAPISSTNSGDVKLLTETISAICPMCCNIIKRQPIEDHYRLLSNSSMLLDTIIVNQIDTQHLRICVDNPHMDPYTPESNESHSPYHEVNSTSITTSSDSYKSKLCVDNTNNDQKGHVAKCAKDNIFSLHAAHAISEKHSRGIVTPIQLKSRLEDLQRISMRASNRVTTVKKVDVNNVEAKCTTKSFSDNRYRNSSNSNCCSIH